MAPTPTEFRIEIPDATLRDLKDRLARTRLPADYANDDWSYGTNGAWLRGALEHWRDRYDWRVHEAAMNRFRHYRVELDGVPVHFVRAPGRGPNPLPLVLSHGWPWTFWDLHRVIGPLSDPAAHGGDPADAFEVIVPSMPGFGFSTPVRRTGVNFWTTADLWHRLMTEVLGFDRYAAQGGDWGALTTTQLGHKYADRGVVGIHLSTVAPLSLFNHERPWDVTGGMLAPPGLTPEQRHAFLAWQERIAAHVAVQVLDPQTLAVGLNDSPAGLLAWLVERRRSWGDCRKGLESAFPLEFLLTTATLYWVTESFATSARFYAEAARHRWAPSHDGRLVDAPTGISYFENDGTVGLGTGMESMFNLVFSRRHEEGGHFAPAEVPERIVADVRATFRELRRRAT
jgi:microsomal epoxide hydrolase